MYPYRYSHLRVLSMPQGIPQSPVRGAVMDKSVVKRLTVAAFGVGMAAALVPAAAYADPAPVSAGELASVAEATDAGMLAAMQRDFGISRDAALNRLAVE